MTFLVLRGQAEYISLKIELIQPCGWWFCCSNPSVPLLVVNGEKLMTGLEVQILAAAFKIDKHNIGH